MKEENNKSLKHFGTNSRRKCVCNLEVFNSSLVVVPGKRFLKCYSSRCKAEKVKKKFKILFFNRKDKPFRNKAWGVKVSEA